MAAIKAQSIRMDYQTPMIFGLLPFPGVRALRFLAGVALALGGDVAAAGVRQGTPIRAITPRI